MMAEPLVKKLAILLDGYASEHCAEFHGTPWDVCEQSECKQAKLLIAEADIDAPAAAVLTCKNCGVEVYDFNRSIGQGKYGAYLVHVGTSRHNCTDNKRTSTKAAI